METIKLKKGKQPLSHGEFSLIIGVRRKGTREKVIKQVFEKHKKGLSG